MTMMVASKCLKSHPCGTGPLEMFCSRQLREIEYCIFHCMRSWCYSSCLITVGCANCLCYKMYFPCFHWASADSQTARTKMVNCKSVGVRNEWRTTDGRLWKRRKESDVIWSFVVLTGSTRRAGNLRSSRSTGSRCKLKPSYNHTFGLWLQLEKV